MSSFLFRGSLADLDPDIYELPNLKQNASAVS
jgi:hypothetical protein